MLLWVYIHTGRAWKICPATVGSLWIYTQSNITNIILFTWVHNTNTEKIIIIILHHERPSLETSNVAVI
jgi:hypothetical protein